MNCLAVMTKASVSPIERRAKGRPFRGVPARAGGAFTSPCPIDQSLDLAAPEEEEAWP